VTAQKLREWRGVKPVAGPTGAAITTRLRTTRQEEDVLDLVAEHLGRLRRADLARSCCPARMDPSLDEESKHQVRKDRLSTRKKALTAESSARWANAIIAANDDQYRLSRDAQQRHIVGLRAAIATLEKRLAQPANDTLTPEQRKAHKNTRLPKGYQRQAERFAKQRRLQVLRAGLARAEADRDSRRVHVVEGGKRLAKTRHHLEVADLTLPEWRQRWNCARYRIEAKGSGDEPFGNLTITVTPAGEVSCGCRNRWSAWPTPNTAAIFCPVPRCSPTVPTSGWPGSLAENPWPTPSVVNPGERVVTSQPRGRRRQTPPAPDPNPTQHCAEDTRSSVWISTTGTSRCGASTPTATLLVDLNESTSMYRVNRRAGMPKCGMRSPASSTTRSGAGSTLLLWKTSISLTPAPWAEKPWAAVSGVNASARQWPGSRQRCSATACPPKPTTTESACTRQPRLHQHLGRPALAHPL
jgi:hypothetical protein